MSEQVVVPFRMDMQVVDSTQCGAVIENLPIQFQHPDGSWSPFLRLDGMLLMSVAPGISKRTDHD